MKNACFGMGSGSFSLSLSRIFLRTISLLASLVNKFGHFNHLLMETPVLSLDLLNLRLLCLQALDHLLHFCSQAVTASLLGLVLHLKLVILLDELC